jgi:pyrroloquinoline quinone biosynthesis protein B
VAVSADGDRWLLLNASPDLRQQILMTPQIQPRGSSRHSPIESVFLTNGDIDHVSGLLCLRERQALTLYGTSTTLSVLAANSLFNVLDPQLVGRRAVVLDEPLPTPLGLTLTPFAVPGKVPLYLETDAVVIGQESEDVVGLAVGDGRNSFYYIPGCADITVGLRSRLAGSALLFFDGTTYVDDEMIKLGLSEKTAKRMGHVAMTGPNGSIALLEQSQIGRKIFIHLNNTNPVLIEGSSERRTVESAGWEIAYDGMELSLE